MPLFMYQAAYTSESWAAQLKNPQNRVEVVGRQACEAVGGKLVGGWYCFGEYDVVFICDVPNNESMSAIALAVAAGGALQASDGTGLERRHACGTRTAFREDLWQTRQERARQGTVASMASGEVVADSDEL